MRIGILGGTFNPIHIGHLILAEEALRILKLDKVIFVPCYLPPHKSSKGVISVCHRLQMVRLAVKVNSRFAVSDIETKVKGKSYTVDTLEKFRNKFSSATELFLVVGSDAREELPRWKKFGRILELARVVIAARPDYPIGATSFKSRIMRIPQIDVSSSEVRNRIKKKVPVRYLVPEPVRQYILEHKLYMG